MSDKDKAFKAAQRRRLHTKISGERKQLSSKRNELRSVNEKLERLRDAKRDLNSSLDDLTRLQSKTNTVLTSDLSKFVGTRQGKYDRKVKDVTSELSKINGAHRANKELINEKIKELEQKKSNLQGSISDLNDAISISMSELGSL
ncbi:hypothetical protein LFYK43_12500 [Ligilactobacillus salitolerans]|uniref:Uncharacterized protein n=1 Tax=Ligilactobacillus salitolerans TaxID=1808352 RepID=A0A401ITC7_9LACO|nr:DUF5082 family protein [Ligilactobacillus salitolerans]GBG94791.1 hypothetical protein LFYK43_12500 [Ligilactobacillus salitolerans]